MPLFSESILCLINHCLLILVYCVSVCAWVSQLPVTVCFHYIGFSCQIPAVSAFSEDFPPLRIDIYSTLSKLLEGT